MSFQNKIPGSRSSDPINRVGDNIYRPLVPGASEPSHFEQLENPHHWGDCGPCEAHLKEDISGKYVLVADVFYYFGTCALSIPLDCRPRVPEKRAPYGYETSSEQTERFIRFIQENFEPGIHGNPTSWSDDEELKRSSCGGKPCGAS